MSIRDEVIESLKRLPADASVDDVEYHMYVAILLHERLANTDRSKNLSLDEVRQRLKLWVE